MSDPPDTLNWSAFNDLVGRMQSEPEFRLALRTTLSDGTPSQKAQVLGELGVSLEELAALVEFMMLLNYPVGICFWNPMHLWAPKRPPFDDMPDMPEIQ